MSNKPSSIIINNAKIDRIDSDNVGFELTASVLDSENDTIPGVEVSLVINKATLDKLISDSDGFIDVKKVLELEEGENISIQLKEVISGVKSKVRMLIDIPNIEEKKIGGGKKKDSENKDVKKESTHEKSLDNKKEKALNLVRINGLNLNTPECIEFSDNEEIITEAVHNNPEAFQYASQRLKRNNVFIEKHILDFPKIIEHIDQSLINKDFIIKLLEINPQILFSKRLGSYLDFNKILEVMSLETIHIYGNTNFIGLENINEIFNKIIEKKGHKFISQIKGLPQLYRVNSIINDKNTDNKQKSIEIIALLKNFLDNPQNSSRYINYSTLEYCPNKITQCIDFLIKNGYFNIYSNGEIGLHIHIIINTNNSNIKEYLRLRSTDFLKSCPKEIIEKCIRWHWDRCNNMNINSDIRSSAKHYYEELLSYK